MNDSYTAEDILKAAGFPISQDRANYINNTNNTNNYTNIKTYIDNAGKTSDDQITPVLRTPLGEATPPEDQSSQKASSGNVSAETPPWKYIKIDLYDNTTDAEQIKGLRKLGVKINYLLPGQTSYKRLSAKMGGRWRDVKRGMDLTGNQDDRLHYNKIQEIYELFNQDLNNVSASKCYESVTKGKGHSVFGLSVVLGEMPKDGEYAIAVIYEGDVQLIHLDNSHLTALQRSKNQIASGSWGTSAVQRVTLRDFNRR